jgi:acetyl-CoA acetyltransferase
MVDALDQDALTCAFDHVSLGAATERYQAKLGLTRQAQDEIAARSHELAEAAKDGLFDDEIVAVTSAQDEAVLHRGRTGSFTGHPACERDPGRPSS